MVFFTHPNPRERSRGVGLVKIKHKFSLSQIRQRMQIQINHLQENFELVEIRLRGLLTQVASLKNSYSVILADDDDSSEFKIVNQ